MNTIFEFSPAILAIIPIIIGLVSVAKNIGIRRKYQPIVAILLGIFFVSLGGGVWQGVIVQGVIAGLSASGLYSSSKTIKNS